MELHYHGQGSYVPPRAPVDRRNTRRSGSFLSGSGHCRRIPIRERRARTRHRNPPPIVRGPAGRHRRPAPIRPKKADPFLRAAVCCLEAVRDRPRGGERSPLAFDLIKGFAIFELLTPESSRLIRAASPVRPRPAVAIAHLPDSHGEGSDCFVHREASGTLVEICSQ